MAGPADKSGIIEFFLIEAGEHLQNLNTGLLSLEKDSSDTGVIDELFRAAHTLKGSAAMMGFQGVSDISHKAEDMLGMFRSKAIPIRKETLNFLFDSVDAVKILVDGIAGNQPEDMLVVDSITRSYKEVVDAVRKSEEESVASAGGQQPETAAAFAPSHPDEDLDLAWERTFDIDSQAAAEGTAQLPSEYRPAIAGPAVEPFIAPSPAKPSIAPPSPPPTPAAETFAVPSPSKPFVAPPSPLSTPSTPAAAASSPAVSAPAIPHVVVEPPQPASFSEPVVSLKQEIEEAKKAGQVEKRGVGRRQSDAAEIEKQFIRVNIDRLDTLMNLVGEMVVNRNRLSRQVDSIRGLQEELTFSQERLLHEIKKFEEKYEYTLSLEGSGSKPNEDAVASDFLELEFDRYDDFNLLSRKLTEITNDTNEVMTELDGFFNGFELDTAHIATITTNLQDEITMVRMVEMDRLYQMFQRPIRDLAQSENKQVNPVVVGGDTKVDKTIFEILSDPLMHMIRNSISHGIETPAERRMLGKDPTGVLIISARHEGNSIVIEVEDDGRGMDPVQLRQAAVEKKFLTEAEAQNLSDQDAINLIFRPGFSTASKVSKVSGRGVGMDVVATQIARINGRIEIKTEKGVGSKFVIKLPLTLAIAQALIVKMNDQHFAVPMNLVEETTRFSFKEMQRVAGDDFVNVRGALVKLLRLNEVLGAGKFPRKDDIYRHPTMILGMADRRVALMVEDIVGREEIVVKSSGDYLKSVRMFSGATISGEGDVRLIMNVAALFTEDSGVVSKVSVSAAREAAPKHPVAAEAPKQQRKPNILVVDDSISIRKYVQRFLVRSGYDVEVAPDGMEALNQLGHAKYDAVITDLEMPVMHGYDLMAEMKKHEDMRTIPVIVLTSRAGEKHRQKALDMGAQDYLVKPFEEQEMIGALKRLLSTVAVADKA
jgi:chemotaxis protein histidine kinase CheA/ActR/RegA family two-component response regulator